MTFHRVQIPLAMPHGGRTPKASFLTSTPNTETRLIGTGGRSPNACLRRACAMRLLSCWGSAVPRPRGADPPRHSTVSTSDFSCLERVPGLSNLAAPALHSCLQLLYNLGIP